MELEKIVHKLNEGIKVMDVIIISDAIDEIVDGGYVDKREGEFLFHDALNDRCPFPVSSFKE